MATAAVIFVDLSLKLSLQLPTDTQFGADHQRDVRGNRSANSIRLACRQGSSYLFPFDVVGRQIAHGRATSAAECRGPIG